MNTNSVWHNSKCQKCQSCHFWSEVNFHPETCLSTTLNGPANILWPYMSNRTAILRLKRTHSLSRWEMIKARPSWINTGYKQWALHNIFIETFSESILEKGCHILHCKYFGFIKVNQSSDRKNYFWHALNLGGCLNQINLPTCFRNHHQIKVLINPKFTVWWSLFQVIYCPVTGP